MIVKEKKGGQIDLYNYDAFEALKGIESNSIDLVATDPPYGIGLKKGYKKGNKLVAGDDGGVIYIWRTANWTLLDSFDGHKNFIWGLEFSPDGRKLFTLSDDFTIGVWGVIP